MDNDRNTNNLTESSDWSLESILAEYGDFAPESAPETPAAVPEDARAERVPEESAAPEPESEETGEPAPKGGISMDFSSPESALFEDDAPVWGASAHTEPEAASEAAAETEKAEKTPAAPQRVPKGAADFDAELAGTPELTESVRAGALAPEEDAPSAGAPAEAPDEGDEPEEDEEAPLFDWGRISEAATGLLGAARQIRLRGKSPSVPDAVEIHDSDDGAQYASAIPEHTVYDDRFPDHAEEKPPLSEKLLAPIAALLAVAAARRQARAEALRDAPEAEDVTPPPDVPLERGFRFYSLSLRALKLRLRLAGVLCLLLTVLSFCAGSGMALFGALRGNFTLQALLLALLELNVVLIGLDVFTEGITSLILRAPGGSALVALSCLATAADAVWLGLSGNGKLGLPFCAVSALSMFFALWGKKLRYMAGRVSFRAAGMSKHPHVLLRTQTEEGAPAVLRKQSGTAAAFVRKSEEPDACETLYSYAAPILLSAALLLAALAAFAGKGNFLHIFSALLACSASFSMFLSFPLLYRTTARLLSRRGAAIAGFSGCAEISSSHRLVVSDSDIFPAGTISIEGIRIMEGMFTDKVISYTGSIILASGCGLAPAFRQLMDNNASLVRHVDKFTLHEGGGIEGTIKGEIVYVGSSSFMKLMGVRLPAAAEKSAVYTAMNGELAGIFSINYVPVASVQEALLSLQRCRTAPLFAIKDFNITPLLIRKKFKMPTDAFDFPTFSERYALSETRAEEDAVPCAVLAREGLAPMVEAAEKGRRLCVSTWICAVLSVVGSAFCMALMFFLFWSGAYDSASVKNAVTYMLLWLVPLFVITWGVRR